MLSTSSSSFGACTTAGVADDVDGEDDGADADSDGYHAIEKVEAMASFTYPQAQMRVRGLAA